MKTHFFYYFLLTAVLCALCTPLSFTRAADPVVAQEGGSSEEVMDYADFDIRLNEIFPNPAGSDAEGEFIEIYNASNVDIDLAEWFLRTRSNSGSEKMHTLSGTVGAESFFVLKKADNDFSFSLTNTFLIIELVAPDDAIVSRAAYENAPEDQSWNHHDAAWYWADASQGDKNTAFVEEEEEEEEGEPKEGPVESDDDTLILKDSYASLHISELLPNPADEEEREYIELYNPHTAAVSLHGWMLRDSSNSGFFIFPAIAIAANDYLVVERSIFGFALNNTGTETVSLFDPREKMHDSVTYTGAREAFVYAWDGSAWRWSPEQTPGRANAFIDPPDIDIDVPKHVYRNVPAAFSISVEGTKNADFSVRWDFGDDTPKSVQKEILHTYTEKGDVDGFVTVTVDGEKIVEEFDVDVEKYPKRLLEITALLPNPRGADTGQEYIIVKNMDRKKIKLGGWHIAVGSHPSALRKKKIIDDITLASGESVVLTREHAAFTLPNHTGVVEIQRPDGSPSSQMRYTLTSDIKEGSLYEKTAGGWRWVAPAEALTDSPDKSSSAAEIIAQALLNEKNTSNGVPPITDVSKKADAVEPILLPINNSADTAPKIFRKISTALHQISQKISSVLIKTIFFTIF